MGAVARSGLPSRRRTAVPTPRGAVAEAGPPVSQVVAAICQQQIAEVPFQIVGKFLFWTGLARADQGLHT